MAFAINPAPAQPWALDLLPLAWVVMPNERELAALGTDPPDVPVDETQGRPELARRHWGGGRFEGPP